MKVNPLGIQAYQGLNPQQKSATQQPGSSAARGTDAKVVIEPQSSVTKSSLAVKVPSGTYANMLTTEERQALDVLFAKFADTARFGSSYKADADKSETQAAVGRMIDVRV